MVTMSKALLMSRLMTSVALFPCSLIQSCHRKKQQDWSGMTWSWWSHAGYPLSPPSLPCALAELPGGSAPVFLWHWGRTNTSVVPWAILSTFLKNGCYIFFFPVTTDFRLPRFFKYNGGQLGNHISHLQPDLSLVLQRIYLILLITILLNLREALIWLNLLI